MANDNNIKEEEIFSQKDTSDVISEILQKYGLDENEEEVFEKLEKVEPLRGEIILDLTIQIVKKKISPKELSPLLQKQLTIPQKPAEDLAQDIKIKLLDLVKECLERERKPLVVETHVPTKVEPLQALFEKQPIKEPLVAEGSIPQSIEEKTLTPSRKKLPKESKQGEPKKPDVYREPIE